MTGWSLYIIRCRNDSLYTGITKDVPRRFCEHQENGPKCAKYLRGRGPLNLVLQQYIGPKSEALKIENKVKQLTKTKKEQMLIDSTVIQSLMSQSTELLK